MQPVLKQCGRIQMLMWFSSASFGDTSISILGSRYSSLKRYLMTIKGSIVLKHITIVLSTTKVAICYLSLKNVRIGFCNPAEVVSIELAKLLDYIDINFKATT